MILIKKLFLIIALSSIFSFSCWAAEQQPSQAAVVSAHPAATNAGIVILQKGGNAFDAAAAVTAALAVVEPQSSGLGGGGFWLLHRASDKRQIMVDARETAPAQLTPQMFLDDANNLSKDKSINSPLSAGIPGIAAGIGHLQRRYGYLSLAEILEPAIKLAEESGLTVSKRYRKLMGFRHSVIAKNAAASSIFLDNGQIPANGARIMQKDLAWALRRMAVYGSEDFYTGEVAKRLLEGIRQAGGVWQAQDLANYRVKERAPIRIQYRDMRIISAPPPSSGGIVLAQALGILENYNLDDYDKIQRMHLIIEAMRRAYRDRIEYLGDPDFDEVPTEKLTSAPWIAKLIASMDLERATPSAALAPQLTGGRPRGTDTTHFSIMDHAGNRVAGTLSINLPFGNGMVMPGTGILLNNELDDFALKPHTPNSYGLIGIRANLLEPGKRPLSSMTPTFVETPKRIAVLGVPGGSRIISMVLLAILDMEQGHPPESWVSQPRYHHQFLPDETLYEPGGLSATERAALEGMGHTLREHSRKYGNMQALMWSKADDQMLTGSDPRGEGLGHTIPSCPESGSKLDPEFECVQ
ncbi:MAG: gamma-glutamyltransferase [Candidatus Eutrophobiaceae bacterium]